MNKLIFFFLILNAPCFAQESLKGSIKVKKEEPLTVVDQMPEFPGGQNALQMFIQQNIVYPTTEKENGIEGMVIVSYIVEKDGSFSDLKIYKGDVDPFVQEALRLFSLMPKWIPGKNKGELARVQMTFPLKFRLK